MKTKINNGKIEQNGFTLLELLVVLSILGLLAAVVGPQVIKYLGSSRSETAHVQVKNIAASLQLFRLDAGRYPTAQEGLEALVKQPATVPNWNGPYLPDATAITDPWSRPYRFAAPGKHGEVDVYTLGSDNASGGTGEARDVGNW
ncbi:MAG: type II secretion system major pseudopilin GspG [Sphingobium sp.]|jgi:general secretion pathway protein G|nr:type II secretion system major pseudopilin GspG [Sphingobium sp.]MCI1271008.1 type II secretion system major pseudopilin GspG [Sphingobium sp.]MCI1755743.1 type II secretion system major pseudopilin GspG [Sphingobium sp.]MCI2053588.1 type II secretion system major pseudopilin GspG [Sphingobium sp.]